MRRVNSNTPGGLSAGQVSLVAGVMGKVPGTFFLRPCLLPLAGFGVPMKPVAHPSAASVTTFTDAKDVNLMPNIDIATPVSSAPSDRLALGVGWVRPGVAGIDGTLNPSIYQGSRYFCFEGNEE